MPTDDQNEFDVESAATIASELMTFCTVNQFQAGIIRDVDVARKHLTIQADMVSGRHIIIDAPDCFAYGNPQAGDVFVVSQNKEFYIGRELFDDLFFPKQSSESTATAKADATEPEPVTAAEPISEPAVEQVTVTEIAPATESTN